MVRERYMKADILTFQFPHNYGAMLQAYALKNYIQGIGCETKILPYYPAHFRQDYSISPLEPGISLRHRVSNTAHYIERKTQAILFEKFKQTYLYGGKTEEQEIPEKIFSAMSREDTVIFGSDQIWNTVLSRDDDVYYGAHIQARKISYAASLGTKQANAEQQRFMKEQLPQFEAISVREPGTQAIVEQATGCHAEVVCDPVFLLSPEKWRELEVPVRREKKYALLYLLKEDAELVEKAREEAVAQQVELLEIHPTLYMRHRKAEQLKNVGPQEFLYLVDHAAFVCTNSFHCVAFSILFCKKLLHRPNSLSPERTMALLKKMKVEFPENEMIFRDLQNCDTEDMNAYIKQSKVFLEAALKN